MRVLRVHEWGADPRVDDVDEPVRGDGETLVAVRAAALSHLDLTVASGNFGFRPPLPYVGGVEGAGVVVESDELAPGTPVLLRGGGLGLMRDGTWRPRASVAAKALTVLDEQLDPVVAATFFVPATTAYVALHDVGHVEAGERVLVAGAAGAVGAMVAQQALLAGAEVLGAVAGEEQVASLPSGVTPVVLADGGRTAELTTERGVDLLVDTLGGDGLITRSGWVRPGGRAVAVGYVAGQDVAIHLPEWLLLDVALLPVNMIRQEKRARQIATGLAAQIRAGELTVAVETVSLDDAPDTLRRLAAGRVRGRAAIGW